MAYYGSLASSNGMTVNIKITLVHIDATHMAVITRSTAPGMDPASIAVVERVISTAKLIPAE